MKPYCGSATGPRRYVEAGRGRADDYYLSEGTGVAQRYVASPTAGVRRVESLAGDGYEAWAAGVDPNTGLRGFVGPFSARAAQIERNIHRYEAKWREEKPGREPDRAQRRVWDSRAWADARPDKVVPRDGTDLTRRWVAELHALGYRARTEPARVDALPVGRLDRDQAAAEVLARLAARRSGWNAADVRGDVEHLIARRNVVTEAAVRAELAEDLTSRALIECVPLIDPVGIPEHIRGLTSRHVLAVEADIAGRLVARANAPVNSLEAGAVHAAAGLDHAQRDVVAALGGDASSAAWLAYQHGYRWDEAEDLVFLSRGGAVRSAHRTSVATRSPNVSTPPLARPAISMRLPRQTS